MKRYLAWICALLFYATILPWNVAATDYWNINANDLIVKNSPYVDVRAYGAVGDNTTDDTAAIQAAIDAVNAAGGGIVFFPEGSYKVTQTAAVGVVGGNYSLMLKSNVALIGVGPSSIINCSDDNTTVIVTDTAATDGAHSTNIRISKLKIVGAEVADTSNRGVYFFRTNYSSLEDVEISGVNIGFQSDRVSTDTNYNLGIVVNNCHVHDTVGIATGNGTGILFANTNGFKVLNNRVYSVAEHGVYISSGTSNYLIAQNDFRSANSFSAGYGIQVWLEATAATSMYGIINANNVYGGERGIFVGADNTANIYRIIVSNNTVYNTISHGIHIYKVNRVEVSNNIVNESGNTGILADYSNSVTMSGNTSEANQDSGIKLYTTIYSTVTGNIVINNDQGAGGYSGITLSTSSTYNIINSNTASDFQDTKTQDYGLSADNTSSYNTIMWNEFTANLSGEVYNLGEGNMITSKGSAAPTTGTWATGDTVYNTSSDNVVLWKCTVAGTDNAVTWSSLSLP